MEHELKFNPDLDLEALCHTLQKNGRLQVPNVFTPDTAEYLYELLRENKDWYLAFNKHDNYYENSAERVNALSPQQRQQLMNNIYGRARTEFQYVFFQYYITQAIDLGEQPGHPMHQLHHFMNSDAVLELMRKLTGDDSVRKADVYATSYAPGHFLTAHNDKHVSHDRVAAYVFSMTKIWDMNWGGHLAFFDDAGNIIEALIPSFNTLNMFRIPQMHSVQLVSPFAGGNRTSYLGWLHR